MQGVDQILLGHALVDHVPQALGARFGGEGQAAFFHPLGLGQGVLHELIHPQAGQGQADPLVAQLVRQPGSQLVDMGIVAAGKGAEGNFFVAGIFHTGLGDLHQLFHAALPNGTVQHARLTEAAAPGAAPHDLQHDTVKDHLHIGHRRMSGHIGLVHVAENPLVNHCRSSVVDGLEALQRAVRVVLVPVQGRHIHAFQPGQTAQALLPGNALLAAVHDGVGHFHNGILAVADHETVEKLPQGFGIEGAGAARHHEGIAFLPVAGADGDAAHIQHIQNVGIAHFILQGKAYNIKFIQCVAAFQRKQRPSRSLQFPAHIRPRHADPLAQRVRQVVQDAIEDFHAQMAHGDLIGIGKTERKGNVRIVKGFGGGVHLAAGIPGRFFHPAEKIVNENGHGIPPSLHTKLSYHARRADARILPFLFG